MRFHGPSILFLAAGAAAAPLTGSESLVTKRANSDFDVVPHDSIKWIPNNIRSGTEGDAIRRYEPYLHIAHGCQSYPAVSATGQVGGGLSNTGSPSGAAILQQTAKPRLVAPGTRDASPSCMPDISLRTRLVLVASITVTDTIGRALSSGSTTLSAAANANPHVFGGAASGHGNYKKTTNPQMHGNRLQVEYFTTFPTNHELQFTNTLGGDFDMIDYDTVNPAIKKAFDEYDWGSTNCPFNQAHFAGNLAEAWI